ncbi:ribbon-helix-helix domain-containing protein [Kumtagia ephedrae]|jgi:antitoxin ParD1/3/4|uniref:Type II toxin-antitoxin system ParD family antitoxin n=1 Tax=Kumtagia ephedrae TaxID=2116701 RepID=A0A2P7STI2_9HYPH|nr:type II toxin-antitoxin system ParD family antitoxin [Mesorhizobium ephedrae]PSJ65793.1 type II toxin-antitoxin system ParD family antitoxin [Mesorhizobium ephedrae]
MTTVSVALPGKMKEYVDAQVEGGDFVDAGDYLRDLVRREQERRLEELRRVVAEARAGGVSSRTTDQIFAEAVEIAKARGIYRE